MSDSRDIELIKDPGLPEHVHRSTDIDPKAAKRAERQIAILFVLIFSPSSYVFACCGVFPASLIICCSSSFLIVS